MDEMTEKQEEATRIIEAIGTTTLNYVMCLYGHHYFELTVLLLINSTNLEPCGVKVNRIYI